MSESTPASTPTVTVTIKQTASPSRSKMAGPCWIRIEDEYASTAPKELQFAMGATVTAEGKAMLRRATRTSTERASWDLVVTGNPDDTVQLSLGSPQPVAAAVTGVREV